ncbi:MAG: hypothetical protein HN861_01495 [Rhodospirillaceae bacterium]|jgi:hypothetical protein|nr:hypothetical protein [Rhodospirillaceae bacterium]MBT4117921.1 hypothetical protein [Rhodospirillaceae bacterium]MBT4671605.1 hypothetical protein [Rhodospirillaceae bacterium]MBT5180440.1 hypothetical protein [Rhodospirillaceae bacterium]MBT6290355.1 hypothetical protein [Rhodospirillaceae bacterium]
MFKYKAIAKIIAGAALMIVAVIALVAWLGACFGTVIVGIALLFLAPQILLLPFTLIGTPAMALIAIGMEELVEDNETRSPPPPHLENMEYRRNVLTSKQPDSDTVDSDSVWNKSSKNLESISKIIEKSKNKNRAN